MSSRGFILIIVVAVLGVLALLAVNFMQRAGQSRLLSSQSNQKSRSRLMARSGVEMVCNALSERDWNDSEAWAVSWNSLDQLEGFRAQTGDTSGAINLNDGISAGLAEFGTDYRANMVDIFGGEQIDINVATGTIDFYSPWGGYHYLDITSADADNIQVGDTLVIGLFRAKIQYADHWWPGVKAGIGIDEVFALPIGSPCKVIRTNYDATPVGISNFRLRLLLNTYGDAHRFLASIGEPKMDLSNFGRAFTFSDSIVHPLGESNPAGDGLGDYIIKQRSDIGFRAVEEVRSVVDAWAASLLVPLNPEYLGDQSFFEIISGDLCSASYEDLRFRRLIQENPGGFLGDLPPATSEGNYAPHPLTPINLNSASRLVIAAVFGACHDVHYLHESALPVASAGDEYADPNSAPFDSWNYDRFARMSRPHIEIVSPRFDPARLSENGLLNEDNLLPLRLMSLRDALVLSSSYFLYEQLRPGWSRPATPAAFRDLLSWHRQFLASFGSGYERSAPGTFQLADRKTGYFTADYVEETLPHVLSCSRRIPGFLGAPRTLLSPYLEWQGGIFKVEDVVCKFHLPKVIFHPGGYYQINSIGRFGRANNPQARSKISLIAKIFQTIDWKNQKDLESITDPASDADILIGPEHTLRTGGSVAPSLAYGFVGLTDIEDVLLEDETPQIVMNFTVDSTPRFGLEPAENTVAPTDAMFDPFLDNQAVGSATKAQYTNVLRLDSALEDTRTGFLTSNSVTSDISPFGGILLGSRWHDPFSRPFSDSIYWRLQDGASPLVDPSLPTAFSAREGLAQLWFRLPTGHQRAFGFLSSRWFGHPAPPMEGYRYINMIFCLRLWETCPNDWVRPINIYLFHSHDEGIDSSDRLDDRELILARYEVGYKTSLIKTDGFNAGLLPGFLPPKFANDPLLIQQQDCLGILPPWDTSYAAYQEDRCRAIEKRIVLKPQPENEPGTWHRLTLGWSMDRDLAASGWGADNWPYEDRFWLRLHDPDAIESQTADFIEADGTGTDGQGRSGILNRHVDVNGSPLGATYSFGDNRTWCHSDDGNMTLNLGEVQAQQRSTFGALLPIYQDYFYLSPEEAMYAYSYYPYWRLNSCLDNFHFTLGPILPELRAGSSASFVPQARYNICNIPLREPAWIVRLTAPEKARILHVAGRIYIPQDSKDGSLEGPNVPALNLESYNAVLGVATMPVVYDGSNAYFTNLHQAPDTRFKFTWRSVNSKSNPLINDDTDSWSEIPWIESVTARYSLDHPVLLNWVEK